MADGVELATAWIRLVPTVEGIQDTVTKEFSKGDSALEKSGQSAGKKWSAGAKAAMTVGAAVVTGAVVKIFSTGLEELKFGEQINAQTEQLVQNTGFAMATEQIGDYTLALSQVSGISEEDLQSAGNNILKFGDVSESVYKDAVDQINNMGAAGKDVAGTSEALGKALADPAKAAALLKRQGVLLNEEQIALIDNMTEAGDKAGAQGVILDALEGTYGGMAEATGGTLQGNLDKLNNAWENLAGAAVESLMPAIEGIVGMLQGLVAWISENEGLVQVLAIGLGILAAAWVVVTAAMWAASLTPIVLIIGLIVVGIGLLVAAILWLVANWDAVWAWIQTTFQGFVSWIGTAINAFVGWWNSMWTAIGKFVSDAWNNWIVNPIKSALAWMNNAIKTGIATIKAVWESTWRAIGNVVKGIWNNVLGFIEGGINGAISLINGMIDGVNNIGGAIGITLSLIPEVSLPRLADGATILPRRGGTAAILAEAGRPETVVDTGLVNRALEEGLDGGAGPRELVLVDTAGRIIERIQVEARKVTRAEAAGRRVALENGSRR